MNPVFFATGGWMLVVVLFKRDLLVQKRSFTFLVGASVIQFIIGVVLHFTESGRDPTAGVLLAPLISLGLYRLLRGLFIKWFKHEPRDTFLNWASGMAEDRFFNILYFAMAGLLWALAPFGMQQLTRAGW